MQQIETYTIVELSLFISSIIGALVLCLKQSQSSKCGKISICWGCLSCDRDPSIPSEDATDVERPPAIVENKLKTINP
tara:strand:- start:6 stop:239 length:234 start_codon:yes stop_codon:yes gene_type:complete